MPDSGGLAHHQRQDVAVEVEEGAYQNKRPYSTFRAQKGEPVLPLGSLLKKATWPTMNAQTSMG
eukprot:10730320-Lingulodinium_polyedra.AAC.1